MINHYENDKVVVNSSFSFPVRGGICLRAWIPHERGAAGHYSVRERRDFRLPLNGSRMESRANLMKPRSRESETGTEKGFECVAEIYYT